MKLLYLLQIQPSEGAEMMNFYFNSASELSNAVKSINKKLYPFPTYRYEYPYSAKNEYRTIEVYAFRVFAQQGKAWRAWKRKDIKSNAR